MTAPPTPAQLQAWLEFRQLARKESREAAARARREQLRLHGKGLLSIDEQRALWPSQGNSYGVVE